MYIYIHFRSGLILDPIRPVTVVAIDQTIFLELWAFCIDNVAVFATIILNLPLL